MKNITEKINSLKKNKKINICEYKSRIIKKECILSDTISAIKKGQFVSINKKYQLGEELDLFTGKTLKQIQLMMYFLYIANYKIFIQKEKNELSKYVHFSFKDKDLRWFFGTNKQYIIQGGVFDVQSDSYSTTYKNNIVNVCIKTDIFDTTDKSSNYTKIFIGNIINSKTLSSVYFKLKLSNFIKYDLYKKTDMYCVYITIDDFISWTNCNENKVSIYAVNMMKSINNENEFKIKGKIEVDNKITIFVDSETYLTHLEKNIEIFESNFKKYQIKEEKNKKKILTF